MGSRDRLTSDQINKLLHRKHSKDVYIPECKTGPSQYVGSCPRLDAWVMRKSWAHPCSIGYEIKIDRGDFLGDKKWQDYLPYCNEFYFVCPTQLIAINEVSPEVGLIWVSKSGNVLYTKKKAQYRELNVPIELYQYVMMWRVKVVHETIEKHSQTEFWREWYEKEQEKSYLGYEVGRKIKRMVAQQVGEVQKRNEEIQQHLDKVQAAERILKELDIDIDNTYVGNIKKAITEVLNGVPDDFLHTASKVHDDLGCFLGQLKKLKKEKPL